MIKVIYTYCIFLSFGWALVVLLLCATPGQYIPTVSWLELLSFDKWVHASVFFILCVLLFAVTIKHNQRKEIVWLYFFLCVLYGGLLEIMQAKCFSNRSADWQDFVANSFGCIVALFCYKKLRQVFLSCS